MKVKDLLEEINRCKKEYGDEFLDWDVYTEQLGKNDKSQKKNSGTWNIVKDAEKCKYFECVGFWTIFPRKKIFTINVNY